MRVHSLQNWLLTSLFLLASTALLSGCGGSKTASTADSDSRQTAGESDADRCEKRLTSALQKLHPQAMATTARRETVVNALNSWLTSCAGDAARKVQISEPNAALLSPTARRFAAAARFTENDTLYIRDCLILRDMTAAVWMQADADSEQRVADDRERVVQLFHEVIRNVVLLSPDEQRIPVGIFEILLTGRGTLEDRIYIFCEALRQRQLDSFILQSAVAPTKDAPVTDMLGTAGSLIAVALGSDLLLFDPVRGSAVPKADDRSLQVTEPAGVAELRQHERWAQPSVSIVAVPGASSPRMLVLQELLPASSAVMLYEELAGGTSEIEPLLNRIAAASDGLFDSSVITVWDYPENAILAAGSLNEDQKKAWQQLMKPYDAPFERDPLKSDQLLDDPGASSEEMSEEQKMERRMMMLQERVERINQSSDELFGKASQRFLKVRLEQVMGLNDVQMIQQLQQIRIASMQDFVEVALPVGDKKEALMQFPLPDAIRTIHRRATGDALFWTAMCQFSRRDFGACVTTLRNYRRQYPEDKWKYASLFNEAMALIQLGDADTAAEVLKQADVEQNAERAQAVWLLTRLSTEPAP